MMEANVLKKVYGDIPVLMLEGDIVDISSYSEADTRNRIDAFIDTLETCKKRGRIGHFSGNKGLHENNRDQPRVSSGML
jgi:hypothetical protein